MNSKCVLCNFNFTLRDPGTAFTKNTILRVQEFIKRKKECNSLDLCAVIVEQFQKKSVVELFELQLKYHKKCYRTFTNKIFITRIQCGSKCLLCEDTSNLPDNPLNVICEDAFEEIKNCQIRIEMLEISVPCINIKQDLCNSTINDMKSREFFYHKKCLLDTTSYINAQELEKTNAVNNEIIASVNKKLEETNEILDMAQISQIYRTMLVSHKLSNDIGESKIRKLLKQLIEKEIKTAIFVHSQQKNKSDLLLTIDQISKKFSVNKKCLTAEELISQAAKLLREQVNNSPLWKFEGNFENFHVPELVSTFFKYAVAGCDQLKDAKRDQTIDKDVNILSQHFITTCRTDRQVHYESVAKNTATGAAFNNYRETPLSIGLSIFLHLRSRSRIEIDLLSSLNLGITYRKLLSIENDIAEGTKKHQDDSGMFCLPSWATKAVYPYFGIDNIDFQEQVVAGKS
jgi:hypothetical protein